MIERLDRSPLLTLLMLSSVVACFDEPNPTANDDGSTEGTEVGPEDTGESGGSGNSTTATDTGADAETDTGVCDMVGCPCEDVSDCADGLECIDSQCFQPVCGDTFVSGDERCDDGNAANDDGCDNDCTFTEILAVEAGGFHTCVLIEGGRVRCWGLGAVGQLGLGNNDLVGDDELPNEVAEVELPAPAVQISASSDQHTCALLEDDTVTCWGNNEYGQLGYANTTARNTPGPAIQVGADVAEIDTGAFHTCVRTPVNNVRCWGRGSLGRLGYASTANVGDDEQPNTAGDVMIGGPVARLSSGGAHNCIISLVGTVRCWGRGELGQLGYGNPLNIGDDEVPSTAGDVSVVPMGLGPFTKVAQIGIGVVHTCAVYETGDAMCWGDSTFGQLGAGTTAALGDDELPSSAMPLEFPDAVVKISAEGGHSCALLEHGDAYCWGSNTVGQLGYGNLDNIGDDEPATEGGPLDVGGSVVQIDAGFFHTCALNEFNEVRCWGSNDYGQLGLGHTDKIGDDELPIEEPPVAIF